MIEVDATVEDCVGVGDTKALLTKGVTVAVDDTVPNTSPFLGVTRKSYPTPLVRPVTVMFGVVELAWLNVVHVVGSLDSLYSTR